MEVIVCVHCGVVGPREPAQVRGRLHSRYLHKRETIDHERTCAQEMSGSRVSSATFSTHTHLNGLKAMIRKAIPHAGGTRRTAEGGELPENTGGGEESANAAWRQFGSVLTKQGVLDSSCFVACGTEAELSGQFSLSSPLSGMVQAWACPPQAFWVSVIPVTWTPSKP
jgi:predicted deacylase